jgi:hypothetical protein
MSEEKELTVREQAVKALKEGSSVVLNGVTYTMNGNEDLGSKSIDELPPEEFFVQGDSKATAEVASKLQRQLAEMQARYDALVKEQAPAKSETKSAEAKTEPKKSEEK